MSERRHPLVVEVDLRGAALDGESRAFATRLLEAWAASPPPFTVSLRSAGSLGGPVPDALVRHPAETANPGAILALWPVWPWRAPSPVVLFLGKAAGDVPRWNPRLWCARRTDLVLVPSRREKVELQVLRRFRRDRVWCVDSEPAGRSPALALEWLAQGTPAPPAL